MQDKVLPQQMGLMDMAGGAGADQQQAQMGAPPSTQNPGGLGPAYDQANHGYEVAVGALEQLSKDLKFVDDAESAQIAMIAAKVNTMRVKRQQQLQDAMSAAQSIAGPGM